MALLCTITAVLSPLMACSKCPLKWMIASLLTPSLPWCHLKIETLKHFFFFALECETIFNKTHNTESRCTIGPKNVVCRCVRASFSAEILHGGAVKGLILVVTCLLLHEIAALSSTHTHTQAHTHARMHEHTHARMHAHTFMFWQEQYLKVQCSFKNKISRRIIKQRTHDHSKEIIRKLATDKLSLANTRKKLIIFSCLNSAGFFLVSAKKLSLIHIWRCRRWP